MTPLDTDTQPRAQPEEAPSEAPLISAIIPVYNARKHLPKHVASVKRAAAMHGDVEIIYVDNGSTDGSKDYLGDHANNRIKMFELPEGHVGAVRNLGAEEARGDYFAFIDADCTIPPNYFSVALQALRDAGADAVGSPYALPANPCLWERTWHRLHFAESSGWTRYLNAGNFFCTREAFEAVGGFDPQLESGEDSELGYRLNEGSFRIFRDPAVRAVHHGNPSTLAEFFHKQLWHGMGALGTFRLRALDRPLLTTIIHAFLVLLGAGLFAFRPSPTSLLAAVLLAFGAPLATVVYRLFQSDRWTNPLAAVLLYWLYFSARAVALANVMIRRLRGGGQVPSTRKADGSATG